tara:strand:- start:1543 stop:2484 length:942 start_codon:yes stop_codon:yes gene_type:complete
MDSVIPEYYLKYGLEHSSPAQFTKPMDHWIWHYVLNDRKYRNSRPKSPNMIGGNAVQGDKNRTFIHPTTEEEVTIYAHGLGAYLFENKTIEESILTADEYLDEKKIMFSGDDLEHYAEVTKRTPIAIRRSIQALKDFGIEKHKNLTSEDNVEWQYPGIDIVTVGKTDIQTQTHVVEFKTIWFRRNGKSAKTKQMLFASNSLPKKPMHDHLLQLSFYWKATNKEPIIVYVTGNNVKDGPGYVIFTKDNCDELRKEYLDALVETARKTQMVRQNLLQNAKTKKDVTRFVQLDFRNGFYWNSFTTQEKQEIENIWI